jgi:MoxR-like ATPase
MGYPSQEDDQVILERFAQHNPIDEIAPVLSAQQLVSLQQACRYVLVGPDVRRYIVSLVHATREHAQVELGASPRAMLGLFHTAQALAALQGRSYVIPDDVKYLMPFVTEHRIIPHSQSALRGYTTASILQEVMDTVAVPVEKERD